MAARALEEGTRRALSAMVIAVDGPAGSGKSSTSRGLAEALNMRYLDTGAMYRAVTWWMLLHGVEVTDAVAVAARAARPSLEIGTHPQNPSITLDGADVARQIRTDGVTAAVSAVSAVPEVRELMRARQRELIGDGGIVVEGRDIGTVVAPKAQLKVFLCADTAVRAHRRAAEMALDPALDVHSVEEDLLRRDSLDSTRRTAPLTQALDAVVVDTTSTSLDEVIEQLVAMAVDRVGMVRDG